MALRLLKIHPKKVISVSRILNAPAIRHAHWYPDYQPSPAPKTEQERVEAAQKYNLCPEEYQPVDDKGWGTACGDYPDVENIPVDVKDPWHPWDYPDLRRDYLDPVPEDILMMVPERPNSYKFRTTPLQAFRTLSTILALFSAVYYVLSQYKVNEPVTAFQYGGPNITHYSFDMDYDKKNDK